MKRAPASAVLVSVMLAILIQRRGLQLSLK